MPGAVFVSPLAVRCLAPFLVQVRVIVPFGVLRSMSRQAGELSLDLTRFGGRSFTFEPTGTHHAENTSTIPTEIQRPNH